MKQINDSELKKIQVDILNYFDAFCKKNDICYWIDYGTLLGAVRHKGFIPWDDDIDIAMLRDDYEKAAELFNLQSQGLYLFQTPTNDKTFCYPFGKIINTKTILYEYGKAGIKTGVYIDVFVYDNSPNNVKDREQLFKRRDLLGHIRRLQLPLRKELNGLKKLIYILGGFFLRPFPRNFINRVLDWNARKYEKVKTQNVSAFTDPYDPIYFAVSKTIFQNLTELEFEGKKYPAPQNYDYWLTVLYGEYMELPPVEKRIHQHTFEAYYKEN